MSQRIRENIFEEIAPRYRLEERLSSDCIKSIIHSFSKHVPIGSRPHLLDIGGGNGRFSSEFLLHGPIEQCSVIDLSGRMLQEARDNYTQLEMQASLIQGDASALPFKSECYNLVLMSFVLHLLPDPETVLSEVRRILTRKGQFYLITYDQIDLKNQVYHRFFPRWYEIDSQRYPTLDELKRLLTDCGLKTIEVSKHPYSICHKRVDLFIDFVKSKPFSTMAKYSDDEFQQAVRVFEEQLQAHFGEGPVEYSCQVTLVYSTRNT